MNTAILQNLIENVEQYDAHIHEENGEIFKRESLLEHSDLTVKYFEYIWEEKGMDEMVHCFYKMVLGDDISIEAEAFLREMLLGIPLFHDLGKINPAFQKKTMRNNIQEPEVFSSVGSRHSLISAVVYMEYFIEQLRMDVRSVEEKKKIRMLILFHAYVISRHHSDLKDLDEFLNSLERGNGMDVISVMSQEKCVAYKKTFSLSGKGVKSLLTEIRKQINQVRNRETNIGIYIYVKMLYSLLVASDFYATSEFMSGTKIEGIGSLDDLSNWREIYESTERMQKIRSYQREEYPKAEKKLQEQQDINQLRTEMLLDVEQSFREHNEENLFYLEAPTGSGKSNVAIDLSFQMMQTDKRLKKIYYIYPFNTLVEQNIHGMEDIFKGNADVMNQIAVVNSLTPIKMTQKQKSEDEKTEQSMYYQKALLDRQFLNYPMIISTHVSLFDTMFGDSKESGFGFHQLMNSVIVLDEIQSYKNTIWGEIIWFLKTFAKLMNIKILIMSATLPDLDQLSQEASGAVRLLQSRKKYFENPCFKDRVQVSYELLDEENQPMDSACMEEILQEHLRTSLKGEKKILIEFIKKDSAACFFQKLLEDDQITCDIEYMSGDDSVIERNKILNKIKNATKSVILVATQVIEAGVDIDMDIGYKNISKLDSEEQFMGRINRSCLRSGVVYFFKMDDGKRIYGTDDVRTEKEFTLEQESIRTLLKNKEFDKYYEQILAVLKHNFNDRVDQGGLQMFFETEVGQLRWQKVKDRMQLISEDRWSMSVYLSRVLEDGEGNEIDGTRLWEQYVKLLQDFSMDYPEKRVKLSHITSQMNYFIYQIKRNDDLIYNDKIGEIFFIENGEQYFENGKLNRKRVQGELGDFVDFI
ncbi:MAG: CRISPR-associated helicase Cas3' [Lachnospiraceae bacterium]|nr:CRISPR-associated helicase Cas3' [Lachnospiraceae bacterium]